jgi:hypothetical protein
MADPADVEAMLTGSLSDPPIKPDLAFMHHLMQTNADMRLQLERLQDAHYSFIQMNQIGDPIRILTTLNALSIGNVPGIGSTRAICYAAEEATIAIINTIKNSYLNYDKNYKK